MKTTELISALLDDVAEHGVRDVKLSVCGDQGTRSIVEIDKRSGGGFVFLRDWREPTLFDLPEADS